MRNMVTAAIMLVAFATTTVAVSPPHVDPGESIVFTSGPDAWLIVAPVDGSQPFVVQHFTWGGEPGPDPLPPTPLVAAIWIIENQEDRTAAQATILDDPVWQAAAIAKGLKYRIEDKDHADAQPFLDSITIPLPVCCTVDGDGNPVAVVPLPAAVGGMRDLIGGVQ